jgi:cytochrome P450
VAKGAFDPVTDMCARLPVDVVADLIGLAPKGREVLLPGSNAVFATFGPLDERMQARMPAFQSYFAFIQSFTDRSKLAPGRWGDAIWDAVDDGRLTPESANNLLQAYLVAAMDTTGPRGR